MTLWPYFTRFVAATLMNGGITPSLMAMCLRAIMTSAGLMSAGQCS